MRRQQQDAVADLDRLGNRVRDEQHGEFRFLPQHQQLVLHALAGQRVERGERFVHQQDVGLHRHAARNRHPLLHAARQRVRIGVGELGQVDLLDVLHGLFVSRLALQLARGLQREHHVLPHRLPRQKLVELLEHHHPVRARPCDALPLQVDLPFGRRHVAAHRLQQRRLPAARRPKQNEAVGALNAEIHAVGRGDQVIARLVLQRDAAHVEQRRRLSRDPASCPWRSRFPTATIQACAPPVLSPRCAGSQGGSPCPNFAPSCATT